MRLIDADEIGLTDFEIFMCNGDYKEALKMILEKIEKAPPVCDIKQIRDEIKDAYDDNRACEQDDVAYGLKVALDIIKEHTKGVN